MAGMTTFNSLWQVAVRSGIVVFLLALSLAHPLTSSRMAGRMAGAPDITIAQLKRDFSALAPQTPAAPLADAAAGDLDLTFAGFGTAGKVITTGAAMGAGDKRGIALQPDGKIVTAGYRDRLVLGGSVRELLVMRYLPNGQLDTTFGGGDGMAIYGNGNGVAGTAVALQADGKIVVAAHKNPGGGDFLLARLSATGALDTSFDGDGWVTTDFEGGSDQANAVLIQPDGKIVAAGTASIGGDGDYAAARYNADGSLDTTFGGDGKASVGMGSTRGGDDATDIALQEDGKLVLVGSRFCCTAFPDDDFAVARLNADGSLDESFGLGGKSFASFGGDEFAYAVAIGLDGKIVVAGDNRGASANVARYHPNGVLDESFDGDGKLSIGSLSGGIRDVAVQPDGKIVLLGYHTSPDEDRKFALYRLNPDSSLDATFFGGGVGFPDIGGDDRGFALALQADGRIIAYGATNSSHALIRLWPDGSLDDGGKQTLGFADSNFRPDADEQAFAMAVQPDGKIVVAGSIANQEFTESDFALARFLPDGQLDLSFGVRGRVSLSVLNIDVAQAVVLQSDGKIVVAGYTASSTSANYNFLIARFNSNGTPDNTFGFGGFNLLDFLGGNDYALALALAPDGKLVVAGTVYNGARYVFGVARFNTDGTIDYSFDTDGKQLIEFSVGAPHSVGAVVVQRDRRVVAAGHVNGDFALLRLREDGAVDYGWGPGGQGWAVFDMGGFDFIKALAITPGGWYYAAGGRSLNGNDDFALAQIMPNGVLASCPGFPCTNWPEGKVFIDWGGNETAFAIDVRSDGQIVAAGYADSKFAWAQVPPSNRFGIITPLKATTDFAGIDCAFGVQFLAPNKLIVAGTQTFYNDSNFALARFETTQISPTFEDVPTSHGFWQFIEAVFDFGITQGCQASPPRYCPENIVTREQMAAFIIRALHPPGYVPSPPAQQRFLDVPPSNPFYAHIEEMAVRQITLGCGGGNYCPTQNVTREQMAAFIIRALHVPGYVPPQPAQQRFADVPPSNPFYAYIEEMAVRGITLGCGGGNYCPANLVTRAQMAVFLARAFNLPLP
jgi:uncharacterized delta-60 repeat protein